MHDHASVPASLPCEALVRPVRTEDVAAISALHARVFGPGRFARTAYRVREGTPAVSPYCRVAFLGPEMVACLRMTPVSIGGTGTHLLLGPLAVSPDFTGQGYGRALVADALAAAEAARVGVVVLVGDKPYYERFGFQPVKPGQIMFPGPVNPARILAREITPGGLAGARGPIAAAPY